MTAVPATPRIGEVWQHRIRELREYEVVRDGNVFSSNLFGSCLFSSEHEGAFRLLADLLGQYQNQAFEDVFSGNVEENDAGEHYVIRSRQHITQARIDPEEFITGVWHDLTLVRGIGKVTERRLKARGFTTIRDLAGHPRFKQAAKDVIHTLEEHSSAGIMDLIGSRHMRSHPMVLGAAGFHEPDDFVFVDIETLGLFSRPIILIGVGTLEGNNLVVSQYLLRTVDEEPAALSAALSHLSGNSPALITYNGKAFDLPYLQDRLAYYSMGVISDVPHFDCLHFARRKWRDRFSSLRLSSLERELFSVVRKDDVPGQMVPEFFETYLKTGNCGPLVPIVNHNRQDVVSLAMIFFHLISENYGNS
ncbi:MAG TPA: ribonuclease H-like domain-containing protein [Methanoregulaceae archaeon]|nr:ribonuclease H-like domain-containing protein [Methanoregulaceae archaeon]